MKSLLKDTGGLRISGNYGYWSFTWPFANLEIFNDELTITIKIKRRYLHIYLMAKLFNLNQVITIKFKEIDTVKRVLYIPFLADGIKINHHAKAPKYILFWSLFSTAKIINILREKGIALE